MDASTPAASKSRSSRRAKRSRRRSARPAKPRSCAPASAAWIRILGKLRYRTSYGQNVLDHTIEVAHLAATMAAELGVDANVARRAGLLHDVGKAIDYEVEGSHLEISVELCRKCGETSPVIHAVE